MFEDVGTTEALPLAKLPSKCEKLLQLCHDHGLTDDALVSEVEDVFNTKASLVNLAGLREQVATLFTVLGYDDAKLAINDVIATCGDPDPMDDAADPSDLDTPFLDKLDNEEDEDEDEATDD